ncbi:MAG: MsnO8 family LLM class oxidoreductase [Burkholderiaceae bacterium]|jgi:luciferase family oxidoreductase group 1|nr:MsnO8 family LLM class oxidoreductase [Burkholderiaceae bacterium]
MTYLLSLLDKSPVAEGESAESALARTVNLARQAEAWGYHRYWLAEHHNNTQLACPTPEILAAYILAGTRRIRVGAGGVMLQHYSPYKVAENVNLLAALAPGRVDIGIGKAPGGLPLSTKALQAGRDPNLRLDFEHLIGQLNSYLQSSAAPPVASATGEEAPGFGAQLQVTPRPARGATAFLLGASVASADLAVKLNWDFVYAAHINGDEAAWQSTLAHYARISGSKPPILAVSVVVADTAQEAAQLAQGFERFQVQVGDGQPVTVGSLKQAQEFVRQAGGGTHKITEREACIIHGTSEQVHARLAQLQALYGVREFVIDNPLPTGRQRVRSIELLARGLREVAASE